MQNTDKETLFVGISNLILGLFIQENQFVKKNIESDHTLMREIVAYIDEHYATPLSLPKIAKVFGYSTNYFSQLFTSLFDIGLPQYINYIRVQKSIKLLASHNVSTLYAYVGFQNPQQYFLNFKKYFGCSPKKYLS